MQDTHPCNCPTLIIHDTKQALIAEQCARELNMQICIETPSDMADALGPMWASAFMSDHNHITSKFIFHCGVSLGLAQACIALNVPILRITPHEATSPQALTALKAIADQAGCDLRIGHTPLPAKRLPPPCGPGKPEQLGIIIKEWLVSLS